MPRKIYDILPPKLAHKVEDALVSMDLVTKKPVRKTSKKKAQKAPITASKKASIAVPRKQGRKFPFKEVLIGGVVIIALLALYLYAALPKATVFISPKTEQSTLEQKITLDVLVENINFTEKTIPAKRLQEEVSGLGEFTTTGSSSTDSKAKGTIKIYNKVDPLSPLTLIKGTHFLSDSGKYFVTLERVVVPQASYQKGKLTPGSVSVLVEAKEAGDDYNIGASKFSVPKLSGTKYYPSIYGESTVAMSGGSIGTIKKVSKEDLENATSSLTERLFAEAESVLKTKVSKEDVLLERAILKEAIEFKSSVKEGTDAENFSASARVKVSALVFKKDDLEQAIKNKITSNLPDGKNLLEKSLDIKYDSEIIDTKGGTGSLYLIFSFKVHDSIDTDAVVTQKGQKSETEIKEIIGTEYGESVMDSKVDFWPFWVTTAPKTKDRVKVELVFE